MTLKLIKSLVVMLVLLMPASAVAAKKKQKQQTDREYWCEQAYKMAQPVLENMAKGELQKNMQLEVSPNWDGRSKKVAYMECFGRLMAGIAPWLTLPDDDTAEGAQRKQLREWALASSKQSRLPRMERTRTGTRRCRIRGREFSQGIHHAVGATRRYYQETLLRGVHTTATRRPSLHQLVPVLKHHRELPRQGRS